MINNCVYPFSEKYKTYTNQSSKCKRTSAESTSVVLGLAIASAVFSPLTAVMVLQPAFPEYRLFSEVFEIPLSIKSEWNILVPILAFVAYNILCMGDLVFIIDFYGIIHFYCTFVWVNFLEPVSVKFGQQNLASFTCSLGCKMSSTEIVQFYRENQLLSLFLNQFLGHILFTIHHASTLMLCTLGAYVCISYPERLVVPGYQAVPAGVISAMTLEYLQMICVVRTKESSERFLTSLKRVVNMTPGKSVDMQKYLKTFRPIKSNLAYPFYAVNKQSFLEFQNKVVDLLVTVLVST